MRDKLGNAMWGIVFIVVGLIVALNAFDVVDMSLFFRGWWTLFIIVPSCISIVKDGFKVSNIIWMLVGVLLLLSSRDIIAWSVMRKLILPIILVAIGLSIIFKDKINDCSKKIKAIKKDGVVEYSATFGEQKASFDNEKFEGAKINATFGGVNLNLKNAVIEEDIVIDVNVTFGGVEIIVPSNVKVKTSGTPIFGGVSNKASSSNDESMYTIYINSVCMFGGVEIK